LTAVTMKFYLINFITMVSEVFLINYSQISYEGCIEIMLKFLCFRMSKAVFAGLSMGHIYLSYSLPIEIYACPIPWAVSHRIPIGMTFLWTSLGLSMGHIYLSHSHPIAIYAYPIPWDAAHGIPIGMTFPWTSLGLCHVIFLALHDARPNFRNETFLA